MGQKERGVSKEAGLGKRPPADRAKVTLTMDHEIVWRLRVKATMMGVAPGELVEGWIRPHVKDARLPYDSYRRGPSVATDRGGEPSASPGDEASDAGPILAIGETVSPPGGESSAEEPGKGRGEARGKRRAS